MSGLALALIATASAQAPPPPTFTVGVEGVYVDAFVTDGNRPVVGLTAADFELKDNGVRQLVELVTVDSLPLSTYLVLDTSGSVAGEKLLRLQAAARALVGGLRAGDEAALVTFDEEVRVRVPPTSDRPRLERAVGAILPGGATALYDALYAGTSLASGRGRSLLVLFTDGEDNMSWMGAAQVRRVLLESNVLVQAVGIVPKDERTSYPGARDQREPAEAPHIRTLRHLAEVTGGRFWAASAPDRLAEAFLAILEAMKTRYVLRFEPDRVRREGLHELEVNLVRRKGRVQSRKAYFVGPPAR
ncbi:MAG TPA: VWA domain-containing protein [Vicinamibacteria bacterium]|nr:VWA domain-containing protein [Vicinamibacteria bacterium]